MRRKLLTLMFSMLTAGYFCSAQVVFDPATYAGVLPAGMTIVDISGTKYLQVVLAGWGSTLPLENPIVIKRSTSFTCQTKYAVGSSGYELSNINTFLKLANLSVDPQVEIGAAGAQSTTEFITRTVNITKQDTVGDLQVAGQQRTSWDPVTGDTMWVGKVTVLPDQTGKVITRETFGTVIRDTDGPNYGTGGYPTHWNWNAYTSLTSTNGHIESGSDSSLRVNNYEDFPGKPANWRTPSELTHAHLAVRPSYLGSFDTLIYKDIDIQGYKANSVEFGYSRSRTFSIRDTCAVNVQYSLDGGAWIQVDTSSIDTLGWKSWTYLQLPLADLQGSKLSILIYAMQTDQIYIDDITLIGDLVLADSMTVSSDIDTIRTSNGSAQLSAVVYPADARQAVIWSVSSAIASIDANGVLTALSNGNITVTATTIEGLTKTYPIVIYGQKPSPMPIAVNVVGSSDGPADYTGTVAIGWDADSVNMEFIVVDDSIVNTGGAEYQRDNIEVYFDIDNSKNVHWPRNGTWTSADPTFDNNDWQFRIIPGTAFDVITIGDNAQIPGANLIYAQNDTGYTFNLKIAWNDLEAGYSPESGARIGFDILLSDCDSTATDANRNQFTWNSRTDKAFNDPSLWGTLEVVEGGAFLNIPDIEIPSKPIVVGTTGDLSAKLTWDPCTDNTGVMSYIIKNGNVNADTILAKASGNTYNFTGLVEKQYSFYVIAVDNNGNLSNVSSGVYLDVKPISGTDVLSASQFGIFPNPVVNTLNINNATSIVMVEVLGINGSVISSAANSSAELITVNTSELTNGMYFIRMTTNDGQVVMSKFVKE